MAAVQGKRYRFDQDPRTAQREDIDVRQKRERPTLRKLQRTLLLGMTLVIPLAVFSLYHPTARSMNPIEAATAAVETGTPNAEERTLVTNGARLKSLARIEANVDAGSGEVRELYGSGSIGGTDPTLRLDFRSRAAAGGAPAFSAALAESMAKMAVNVRKFGAQQSLATSRGPIAWADLAISTSTGPKSCLAFQAAPADDKRMTGLLCGANGVKPDLAALSCVIDRLELTEGAVNAGFKSLLRGSAATHGLCKGAIL